MYTQKGLSIDRVNLDLEFWSNNLCPKLIEFYDNCIAPEIVSPVNILGMSLRDIRKV